jgi:hypothetical protein
MTTWSYIMYQLHHCPTFVDCIIQNAFVFVSIRNDNNTVVALGQVSGTDVTLGTTKTIVGIGHKSNQ